MRFWGTWRHSVWVRFQPCWMEIYQEKNWGTCSLIVWTQRLSSTSEEVGDFNSCIWCWWWMLNVKSFPHSWWVLATTDLKGEHSSSHHASVFWQDRHLGSSITATWKLTFLNYQLRVHQLCQHGGLFPILCMLVEHYPFVNLWLWQFLAKLNMPNMCCVNLSSLTLPSGGQP